MILPLFHVKSREDPLVNPSVAHALVANKWTHSGWLETI